MVNGAPGQDYPIIIQAPDVCGPVIMRATWGFVPLWAKERNGSGRPPPINAKSETVATNGVFRHAYASRRALPEF
ncbi:MAG: SOS response-associated peptidase [Rhizobiaceae bacterium]|nr:SOS response-associated peptidase [Rhizobiaceae bacterium]